jgi:periplasmic divalent cation tolerance protein
MTAWPGAIRMYLMINTSGYSLVMTTTDSDEEARSLATYLVENGLAACVQLSRITSHYVWEGKPTAADEVLLFIKTRKARVQDIMEYVGEHHSYETPELVEVPIVSGLPAYLRWMDEVVTDSG